jgi:hypothetical protein
MTRIPDIDDVTFLVNYVILAMPRRGHTRVIRKDANNGSQLKHSWVELAFCCPNNATLLGNPVDDEIRVVKQHAKVRNAGRVLTSHNAQIHAFGHETALHTAAHNIKGTRGPCATHTPQRQRESREGCVQNGYQLHGQARSTKHRRVSTSRLQLVADQRNSSFLDGSEQCSDASRDWMI